ncbi:MAG: hypothetical protein ACHQF0_16400 [Chitinophagales bacterium]
MNVNCYYWLANIGSTTASLTIALAPSKTYLVTGGLTLKEGDDHARVYIGMVCTGGGDNVSCGIRDSDGDSGLGITEFISNAVSVTVKLNTTGGKNRAEGVIYEL